MFHLSALFFFFLNEHELVSCIGQGSEVSIDRPACYDFPPLKFFPFSQLHSAISKIMINIEYICCASAPLVSRDQFLLSILRPSLSLDSDISFPIYEWLLCNGCLGQFNSNPGQPQDNIFFFFCPVSAVYVNYWRLQPSLIFFSNGSFFRHL